MFNEYYDAKLQKKGRAELRFIKRKLIALSHDFANVHDFHIHIVGICGTAMGTFALMLRDSGFKVSGSDISFWEPMGPLLKSSGVEILEGWSADHITDSVNLVVPGNACAPDHVEVAEAERREIPLMSMPEIMGEFYVGKGENARQSLVVAGTHGKTTTSGLLAHMLTELNLDPTYLIGGVMQSKKHNDSEGKLVIDKVGTSHHVGAGKQVVFEGDEYDTSFFDARPKFMHYRPTYSIITSVEWDHIDIYESIEEYTTAFSHLFVTTQKGLVVSNTYPLLNDLTKKYLQAEHLNGDIHTTSHNEKRILTYGIDVVDGVVPDIRVVLGQVTAAGTAFDLYFKEESYGTFIAPMYGSYNVLNSAAVLGILLQMGIDFKQGATMHDAVKYALSVFPGMKRRQEVVYTIPEKNITIIDDFAHHPTAVAETLAGIRNRFADRRIVALFEPRSNTSRRKLFEHTYPGALAVADLIGLKVPPYRAEVDAGVDLLDPEVVKKEIEAFGKTVYLAETAPELASVVVPHLLPNDVIVVMSNGSFDGMLDILQKQIR